SPIWVVAAMATSSTRSGGRPGLRRMSSRMTRTTMSSARVSAYSPFGPDLPKGVRTPSTNTTSREEGTDSLLVAGQLPPLCYWSVTTAHARLAHRPARRCGVAYLRPYPGGHRPPSAGRDVGYLLGRM